MPEFSTIAQLEKFLQQKINDVLNNEVARAVKEEILMAVDEVIYRPQEPERYKRRGLTTSSTGLGGITQMHHTMQNGVLEVTDDAKPFNKWDNGYTLAENIEYGYGQRDTWYNKPRPFIEHARGKLRSNKYHIFAMKEGLGKKGLDVE